MTKITVLSAECIADVLTLRDVVDAVEDAYAQKAQGVGIAWPMVYEQFRPGPADMDIRSGELAGSGLFGLKLTSWFSGNAAKGLSEVMGTTLLCDNKTGVPLALLNASAITGLRTGAAGALGVKWLARKDAKNLLIAGAGHMSAYQVAATLLTCPDIDHVEVWDPAFPQNAAAAVELMKPHVAHLLEESGVQRAYDLIAVDDGEAAVGRADAIITITPATIPFIRAAWVRPGTHISAVGADMEGKQELETALVAHAKLFADDRAQSASSGEFEIPAKGGILAQEGTIAEIGEVIVGIAPGRTDRSQITVFDTSGIAVQDLAAGKVAYERAVERGMGARIEL